MNLALRGARGLNLLEKWYIDVLLPDGGVLLVYLGVLRILGVTAARVTAELFEADGTVRRGAAAAQRPRGAEDWLAFGPARIEGQRLSWTTNGLSGELDFSPRHVAATPRDPFLACGRRRILWTLEVPDADVRGRLQWPGGERAVEGRGYRDRVWSDIAPWRFPLRRLEWGRAVTASHAAVWVAGVTESAEPAAHWLDGDVREGAGAAPEMAEERVLVDIHVADLEGLRLGPLRPLVRRLSRDPHEVKWAAAATLLGERGRAIHERVLWR